MANKFTAEAEASRLKTAADEADEECAKAYQQRDELEARLAKGIEVDLLQKDAKKMKKELAEMAAELQFLCRDVNYILLAGRLKLAHVPSYSEVLWVSPGVLEPRQPVSSEERETAWRAVTESLRLQHRNVAGTCQFIEDQHENPSMNV